MALLPRTVADFYADFMAMLEAFVISVTINTLPTEVANPIRCDMNRFNSAYDPDPVNRWWRIQLQIARVLDVYRSTFAGKSSPINFFWGSFDLSHTRWTVSAQTGRAIVLSAVGGSGELRVWLLAGQPEHGGAHPR